MIRTILLLGMTLALSAAASAHDPHAYRRAYWGYIHCNEDATRELFRRELTQRGDGVAFLAQSRELLARDAMAACKAEADTLAALFPGGPPNTFALEVQQYNLGIIERERHFQKHGIVCAGAEWEGCSMKSIPGWKDGRP